MFVHLHVHSAFSFLDGGSSIEDLVQRAAALDMSALALTDHDNMCGAVKFHAAARKYGIKPIQGVEITMDNGSHLTVLAENPNGYRNLCRLLSRAHLENPRGQPGVSWANLLAHRPDLIFLSGCRKGEISSHLLRRNYHEAYLAAARYKEMLGCENFFIELQDTFLPGAQALNHNPAELAEELDLGIAATNNVHYADSLSFRIHDILTCVRTLSKVYEVHPERPLNGESYLKPSADMIKLFHKYPPGN